MKKIILLSALCAIILNTVYCQTPQAFKYQAVARDNAGNTINNQLVSFRISILQGTSNGASVYVETHQLMSNDFGLANLEIGDGSIVSGSFSSIDWSLGSYFLKIEMDASGGSSYQLMGTSQMLSVPYALFAESTANPGDNDWTVSGNDMFSSVSGNVGIGTNTPYSKLDVAGHISFSNTGSSVFIGSLAGYNDDLSDNSNVFIGKYAGYSNTAGFSNTAIGRDAMIDNTIGDNNTAIGSEALPNNISGNNNTALGWGTLHYTNSGNNNTSIGYRAGYGSTGISVNGCVYLGYQAGYNNTSSNKLYIENSDSDTPLIYGDFSTDYLKINGELDVAGHISTSSTGSSVFLGWGAGYYDDLSNNYNVYIGQSSGNLNTTGDNNTACGSYSLFSSVGGAYNTVVGQKSLYYNVSGNNNTAIGNQAGHGLYGASVNGCVFLGNEAGYYNGTDNRLFIENSDSNTPLIYGEFDNDIVGINGNLGVGTSNPGANLEVFDASGQADIRITRPSSTYAAALGFYTGSTDEWRMVNASGSKNLLIHRGSGNTTGNLGLMYNGGNVGIGTSSPAVKAHIVGGTDASLTGGGYLLTGSTTGQNMVIDENEIMARNNGATSALHLQRNGGGLRLHYDQSDYDQFNINSSGWTGIGVTSPNSKLHVNTSGDDGLRVQIYTNTKFLVHSNGGVVAGHNVTTPTFAFQLQNSSIDLLGRGRAYSWNTYSDSRLKSNQRQIEYGLKEVLELQPKSYMHHSSSTNEEGDFVMVTDDKISTVGFIAQEVQQIIPEAVCEPLDVSKDLWSMDYDKLIPVLTKAIQEQQAMIEEMRIQIEALTNQSE